MAQKRNGWRARYGVNEVVQRVRPAYTDEYLMNPHKGTTTFQRFEGETAYPGMGWDDRVGPLTFRKAPKNVRPVKNYPPTRLSYCRWLWSVLEPKKGKIRWDIIDGSLKAAADRGQTLQIRTQPYIGNTTPAWYWNLGGKAHKAESKQSGYPIPDHNHPSYLKHWGDHIRMLGERYDGHPGLESFDIAYGGHCGETGGNCKAPMARKLVDVYLKAFRKTQLLSMLGTYGCTHAADRKGGAVGWRADCYGDVRYIEDHPDVPDGMGWNHMLDLYAKEVNECGVKDAWKTSPITFETCWTVPYWEKMGWDLDWIIDQGYKYHISVFMPKSCLYPAKWMDKMAAFDKKIGYRFFLHNMVLPLEARAGQAITFETIIDNKGIAPIYRPYKLAYRFTQGRQTIVVHSKQDIRTWMPDFTFFRDKIAVPAELQPGEAKIAYGIVDDKDVPAVRFAMKPIEKSGWHPLTSMDVI